MTARGWFWEGVDTAARPVRATLATANVSGKAFVVPRHMALPVVIFRVRREWKVEHYRHQDRVGYAYAVNEARLARAAASGTTARLKPLPRESGASWVVATYVEWREVMRCRSLGTPLGLATKFTPNMPRLTVAQLGELVVAFDAWTESGRAA